MGIHIIYCPLVVVFQMEGADCDEYRPLTEDFQSQFTRNRGHNLDHQNGGLPNGYLPVSHAWIKLLLIIKLIKIEIHNHPPLPGPSSLLLPQLITYRFIIIYNLKKMDGTVQKIRNIYKYFRPKPGKNSKFLII